jgi:hypothetical protein
MPRIAYRPGSGDARVSERISAYRRCRRTMVAKRYHGTKEEHSYLLKPTPLSGGALVVLAVAIIANTAALMATNPKYSSDGDGPFYINIARNLAAGKGYVLGAGQTYYPDQPTMGRAPVWPVILSVPSRLAPGLSDLALLRGTAAWLNVATSLILFGITFLLCQDVRISMVAGAAYALYPVALALTAGGFSEIPYAFIASLGLLLILRGGSSAYFGALVFGLAPLVRSNFIVLPVMVGLVALPRLKMAATRKRFVAMAVLFWLPSSLWICRNYLVGGQFPVLSTIEGETLYGANNDFVNSNLSAWGYWVFPDEIPGETPKQVLAQTLSERQMDVYYHRKGVAFLKAHWLQLPRLELGKLIRAFVPVPWVASPISYVVFLLRAVLYLGILLELRKLRQMDSCYRLIVTGMFLALLVTVLIYYGTYRFTFCVEIFLIPAVVIGVFSRIASRKKAVPELSSV